MTDVSFACFYKNFSVASQTIKAAGRHGWKEVDRLMEVRRFSDNTIYQEAAFVHRWMHYQTLYNYMLNKHSKPCCAMFKCLCKLRVPVGQVSTSQKSVFPSLWKYLLLSWLQSSNLSTMRPLITDSNTHNSMLFNFAWALPSTSLAQLSLAQRDFEYGWLCLPLPPCLARLGSAQLSAVWDFTQDLLSDDYFDHFAQLWAHW